MTKFTGILATGMLVAGFVPSVFGGIFCDDRWVAVGATFSEWDVSSSFQPAYTGTVGKPPYEKITDCP